MTIGKEFPLAELHRLRAVRQLWSFDATGTELGDEHIPYVSKASCLVLDGTKIGDAGLARLLGSTSYIKDLSIADTAVNDAGLATLTRQTRVDRLNLSGTAIGRPGLEALSRNLHPHPRALNLSRTTVGDDEMGTIAKLVGLDALNLSDTRVTDAGLVRLASVTQWSIDRLVLDRTRIGDEGLRALFAKVPPQDFDELSLSGTSVTWEHIETWKSAPRVLRLSGLDIGDESANWFVKHGRKCDGLDLSETRLTDTGLGLLEECGLLRRLCVKNCAITETAAAHFMESHPTRLTPRRSDFRPTLQPLADRMRVFRETGWLER
jgi:hypothetical protein